MKYIHKTLIALFTLFMVGCGSDNIKLDERGTDRLDVANNVGFTLNSKEKKVFEYIEYREDFKTSLHLSLTEKATSDLEVVYRYNLNSLLEYNKKNESDYKAFPEELMSLLNDGKVSIKTGETKSNELEVLINCSEQLDPKVTYVIPLTAYLLQGDKEDVTIDDSSNYLIFVRDMSTIPTAEKPAYYKEVNGEMVYWKPATKVISCMEVNDTNPLNNLNFTLKSSGKPLVDIVILFSGNINYNLAQGRVYNSNNANIQHLLDHREKYLKPLQDRGIKVVLGILGNGDQAAISNLADDTARAFAQELKSVCEAYSLDGIFFDDEYSQPSHTNPPIGFVSPNTYSASRLVYETKKAMPDKIVSVYIYNFTEKLVAIDGVLPGDYIDYAIADYGKGGGSYPGITNEQYCMDSQEYNLFRNLITDAGRVAKNKEYGGMMIFAMDPNYNSVNTQISSMRALAKGLYDEELVVDENYYKKDW